MTRTSKRLTARAAARHRQAKANQDQRQREQTELNHATEFEVARMRRDDAAATVVTYEIQMARQIDTLLALGNPIGRVADLTGETEAEIKRLRKAAADTHRNAEATSSNNTPGAGRRRTPVRPPKHSGFINTTTEPACTDGGRFASTSTNSSPTSSSDLADPDPDG